MTNDSKNIRCAINYLEELKCHTSGYAVEWLDMAIRALNVIQGMEEAFWQALPVLDMRDATEEERSSLKRYIDSISKSTGVKFDFNGVKTELEPCDDCVSRTDVDRLLMDLGIENAYDMPSFWANKGKDFKVIPTKWHQGYQQAIEDFGNRLKELSSVKSQRTKGKWLDKKMTIKGAHGMAYGRYACSVCKKKFPNKSNYCPNCGAEMEDSND